MEVKHAQKRVKERNIKNINFLQGDMEKMPFDDNQFDVVISNGAFCLTPYKEKAFREIFRVLKKGGRMSICTSVKISELEKGVNWPICMRMFIDKGDIRPIVEKVGFVNILVDDSNSLMQYELPEVQKMEKCSSNRHKVHVGSKEFKHLKDFDMNKLTQRVIVYAVKE